MALYLDLDLPTERKRERAPNASETGVRRVPLVSFCPDRGRFVSANPTKKRWSAT